MKHLLLGLAAAAIWLHPAATHANPVDGSCYMQMSGQTLNLSRLCGRPAGTTVSADNADRRPNYRPRPSPAQRPTVTSKTHDGRGAQGTRVDATLYNNKGDRIDLTDRQCDRRRHVDARYDIDAQGQLCGR